MQDKQKELLLLSIGNYIKRKKMQGIWPCESSQWYHIYRKSQVSVYHYKLTVDGDLLVLLGQNWHGAYSTHYICATCESSSSITLFEEVYRCNADDDFFYQIRPGRLNLVCIAIIHGKIDILEWLLGYIPKLFEDQSMWYHASGKESLFMQLARMFRQDEIVVWLRNNERPYSLTDKNALYRNTQKPDSIGVDTSEGASISSVHGECIFATLSDLSQAKSVP